MAEYPGATTEQCQMMASITESLYQKRGGGEFEPKQLAIISTLCERLVAANPDLERFVESLREIVRAERAAHPQLMSWRWLDTDL
ncbi:hypothetical protein [Kribbella monticola]|uniref:hypothetical protein n=1 Tax=Kribbella monticola TaxID=2185285 RepID=UPI0013002871|nr:hypothetical protein [Kribbella monticola]